MSIEIFDASANDNELGNIYRDGWEYIIEINWWDGRVYRFRTVECKYICHHTEIVDEIGEITLENDLYKFLTVDGEDTILEIKADQIVQIE
ncbi:MAG: hypothetical protein J6A37_15395 [Oscillospiraceae bacterium]|nr:hypothetical protein [Oscillospiraceae bacterium]